MAVSDDIIVVVPPGTRVRYIENGHIDGRILIVDAHQLQLAPLRMEWELSAAMLGVPIHNAEKWIVP